MLMAPVGAGAEVGGGGGRRVGWGFADALRLTTGALGSSLVTDVHQHLLWGVAFLIL